MVKRKLIVGVIKNVNQLKYPGTLKQNLHLNVIHVIKSLKVIHIIYCKEHGVQGVMILN